MNLRLAIQRHEREAVKHTLCNQSKKARREFERVIVLRVVRKIRKEMRS